MTRSIIEIFIYRELLRPQSVGCYWAHAGDQRVEAVQQAGQGDGGGELPRGEGAGLASPDDHPHQHSWQGIQYSSTIRITIKITETFVLISLEFLNEIVQTLETK